MWNLDQDTGAIASLRIAAAGSAVRQVGEHLDSLADDLVALVPGNASNKTDPASVMLMRRIVQTLGMRQATLRIQTRHPRHLHRPLNAIGCSWALPEKGNWSVAHPG